MRTFTGGRKSGITQGAGGACRQGWAGGDGGGQMSIRGVNIVTDGIISANGASGGGNNAGSGSGGSINFAVSTLSGAGQIRKCQNWILLLSVYHYP